MTEKTVSIAVQYTRHASAKAHVRSYQNNLPLKNEIQIWLNFETLPEPGHHRVELEAKISGINTDGVLCFETSCCLEAIAVCAGIEDFEAEPVLREIVAPALMGSVRALLTTLSLNTGYGPLYFPPMMIEQIAALQPRPGSEQPKITVAESEEVTV